MPTSAGDLSPFLSIDDVVSRFAAAGYITDRRLATTIYLVTRLNKPVLLEGPAGVGKTELAKTLATVTGRPAAPAAVLRGAGRDPGVV